MYRPSSSASAYRNVGLDTAQQLSQHRQLVLLLNGLVDRLRLAESLLQDGDISGKAKAITSAFPILEALRGSLDFDTGGELAEQLASVYDAASLWLLQANAYNDAAKLRAVIDLLKPVAEAYAQIPEAPRAD